MMKRWLIALMTAVMVISFAAMPVSAAGYGQRNRMTDADGDGVCDNWETGACGENGPVRACCKGENGYFGWSERYQFRCGIRLENQKDRGNCKQFVNADENGIGDRLETGMNGAPAGQNGNGNHNQFVDANEDGICDRYEECHAAQENGEEQTCPGSQGKCDGTGSKGYGWGRKNR